MPITVSYEEWLKDIDAKADDIKVDRDEYYEMCKQG